MEVLKIKTQLTAYGLNPTDWSIRLRSNSTALLIHQSIDDFVLVAKMKNNFIVNQINLISI